MEILGIALLAFIASIIGTFTGFGISTIMIPVVLLILPLAETLLLVGLIHFFGDIWKIILFRKGIRWKLVIGFAIPGIVFSYIGARIALNTPSTILTQILGAFLVAYVIFVLTKHKFKLPQKWMSAITGGALSGLTAGIFGMGGAVRAAFLSAYNLPKSVYIFTIGLIAFFIDITRLGTYVAGGTKLDTVFWWGMILFIPITFIGAEIAKKFLKKVPQKYFRTIVVLFLFVFGIKLLFFP